ncbi:hypothetical protein GCM10023074_53810 [Microbispora amethystogenes]|uniref:Uncharacterized protein n=1 Tax=Microbispora amethystogenes TaxID=1427754 RepID=A0ABQ4FHE0_9ACTN|nr:hypothetical protein Mam01_44230 [Microbispora amethystogenes]
MPASSAISRTVVAWKPLRANNSAASLTRCSRRSDAGPATPRLALPGPLAGTLTGTAVPPDSLRWFTAPIMAVEQGLVRNSRLA